MSPLIIYENIQNIYFPGTLEPPHLLSSVASISQEYLRIMVQIARSSARNRLTSTIQILKSPPQLFEQVVHQQLSPVIYISHIHINLGNIFRVLYLMSNLDVPRGTSTCSGQFARISKKIQCLF